MTGWKIGYKQQKGILANPLCSRIVVTNRLQPVPYIPVFDGVAPLPSDLGTLR